MFVVHGTFPVKSSAVEEMRAAIPPLQEATRAEAGNLSYEWVESVVTPGTFLSIETWESQDALNAHFDTDHVKAALTHLPGWLAGEPTLHGYEAAEEITLSLG